MTEPLALTDQERVELVARMVRDLLAKYQLAGTFFLSAPTHCADAIMFDTAPWLCLRLEVDSEGLMIGARMRSKREEYRERGLSEIEAKAAQEHDIAATINTLDFLGRHMGEFAVVAMQLCGQARDHFGALTVEDRVGDAWGRKPS